MKRLAGYFLRMRWLCAVALPFSGALLAAEPAWITVAGPNCPLLRKECTLSSRPKKAVMRIVGLGHFELRVNGQRAGQHIRPVVFRPG